MGVDWLSCSRCGDTFPDCGDFVSCSDDCYKRWCSDECAEQDGYSRAECKAGCDISVEGWFEDDVNSCIKIINKDMYTGEYIDCNECPNYVPTGCKYCRNEDYSDEMLLDRALDMLNMTREELVNKINEVK